jgi:hypothetical protein
VRLDSLPSFSLYFAYTVSIWFAIARVEGIISATLTNTPRVICHDSKRPVFDQYGKLEIVKIR